MKNIPKFKTEMIAPCGINCVTCMAYLRDKNKCPGCRADDENKSKSVINCKIRNCNELTDKNLKYCCECSMYPCSKINHIDKRYKTKYFMSMIENLDNIKNQGIKKFMKNEKIRWTCTQCGGIICVHRGYCYNCKKIYFNK